MSESPTPHQPPPLQRWLAELKRRRVFRVIAVYGAVSFVVMEAADVIFPAIPLPDWSISLVLWMAVLGFPIAVVLAWAFEMTPDGVRRTAAADTEELASILAGPARARWPSGVFALVGLALLAAAFYGGRRTASVQPGRMSAAVAEPGLGESYVAPSEDPRPAIAVLPFADMSPEGDQEYFSDGISEEILTVLSRIRELRVAARSSAFTYKGSDLDLRQIGQELGVPYLLGGSVRKAGDRIRITAELVGTDDNFRLWTESYDRRLDDVFAIQTEIAEAISDALRIPLGLAPESLVSPTPSMEAHDLYLSGRAAHRRRGTGVAEAIHFFEAAIASDSSWAPAWAGLAEAHASHPLYAAQGLRESEDSTFWSNSLQAAEAAARRALELDPRNASARVALGGVHRDRWEWPEGEREFLEAIALDPDAVEAHIQYGELLWGVGRLDESSRETGRALALERTPVTLDVHAFVLLMNGRGQEAERLLEEGIALDTAGDMHFLRTVLAQHLLMEGRFREALERFSAYLPDPAFYRAMGEALESGSAAHLPRTGERGLTQTLVKLGEIDRALDALEARVFAVPYRVQYDVWDPVLAPLWTTTRFQEVVLPRVNLEGVTPRYLPPVSP